MKLKALFMEEPVDFEKGAGCGSWWERLRRCWVFFQWRPHGFMEILGLWLETALSRNFIPGSGSALWPAGLHPSGRTGDI